MSWEVTAKVSGGCKYSTEETEAYMRAAKALSHQADALSRAHDSVRALSLQLSSYPYASSAIASLSGSSPYCNATDHIVPEGIDTRRRSHVRLGICDGIHQ